MPPTAPLDSITVSLGADVDGGPVAMVGVVVVAVGVVRVVAAVVDAAVVDAAVIDMVDVGKTCSATNVIVAASGLAERRLEYMLLAWSIVAFR